MERTPIAKLKESLGKEVKISAWIDVRRDQGKLIFLDFRDFSGKVQGVILPNNNEAHATGSEVRPEWVVEVRGKVNPRPERAVQKDKFNGDIELEILQISVLNKAETPPFEVEGDGKEVSEEIRLRFRYVDLRRERMKNNMVKRHEALQFVRNFYSKNGFLEIETPCLTKSTPEGSRDFLVPARIDPGKFYALPQSPQQYKQFLMSAGFEKYFQIARCFRDEDTRGDRQPEFTQIDVETSFENQKKIMQTSEDMLIAFVKTVFPNKKIQTEPFPRLSFKEAMKKYGTDKPDLREDKTDPDLLAFCWVIDFPFFERDDDGGWTFTHNPFSAPIESSMEDLTKKKNIGNIQAAQYDIVLNGYEIGGGGLRNHNPEALQKVFEIMGYSKEKIENNFSHMLKALGSGTPPHGGIAFGFDRIMMLLLNEPNIRETIAFPKTGEGRDPLMDGPTVVVPDQLDELGITLQE